MTAPLGDQPQHEQYVVKGISGANTIAWEVEVPIGASGAVGTLAGPYPNGFSIVKNTTGVYDITGMPPCPAGNARLRFGLFSAALTVVDVVVTAHSATAGTATIKTLLNDAAAQPASGDKIWIFFSGEPR